MKYLKTIVPFVFVSGVIFFAGCEKDEPEIIPDLPQIAFNDIAFINGREAGYADSIKLTITFSDGDFDLGLNPSEEHFKPPFNLSNFFFIKNGTLHELASALQSVNGQWQTFITPSPGQTGKLATYRKIVNDVNAMELYSCQRFEWTWLWINEADFSFIDNSYAITDTIFHNGTKAAIISDTLLVEANPNGFNIDVDFMVEQNDGSFTEFDWHEEFCVPSFDGRFPVLEDLYPGKVVTSGPFRIIASSGRSGQLSYTMTSLGFRYVLKGKNIRLRVSIKDRSLNESNVIETSTLTIPQ